jgi:hypothetical protein
MVSIPKFKQAPYLSLEIGKPMDVWFCGDKN